MRVLIFSTNLSETFIILRRTVRGIIIKVHGSLCKVPVIFVGFLMNLAFLDRFSKKDQMSDFMKICPVGAKLFHSDGWTDGQNRQTDTHDEGNGRFSQFRERT
jgi:hypothetical protein